MSAPVIKCDSGLQISGLGGFPGPYSSYVERTLGVDRLLWACDRLKNRSATVYSVIAFCNGHCEPVMFHSETKGDLLKWRRGRYSYFFDFILYLKGTVGP